MVQTGVEIVKPGGTGSPALVISARPEPLPPSVSFIVRSPSALPAPKKYTYLPALPPLRGVAAALTALTNAFATEPFLAVFPFDFRVFAITLRLRLRNNFRDICKCENEPFELLHEA